MLKNQFTNEEVAACGAGTRRAVIHLSETGLHAGRRFCGADGDDGNRSVHGAYAPLGNPDFRRQVCEGCLMIWATEAYGAGDEMPDYIVALREKNREDQAKAAGVEVDPRQLALVL